MKKIIFSLICFCACLPLLGALPNPGDYNVLFVNKQTQEFTGLVGQVVSRTGLVRFADAEIPPDPNSPVDRALGDISPSVYSLVIEGADASQFTANIVWQSYTSNQCTVMLCYLPQTLGAHSATLRVYCTNAGVPMVSIPLRGEATGVLGDLTGDGLLNIQDVTSMINLLLIGQKNFSACDFNGDGQFSISDVTALINRLLTGE